MGAIFPETVFSALEGSTRTRLRRPVPRPFRPYSSILDQSLVSLREVLDWFPVPTKRVPGPIFRRGSDLAHTGPSVYRVSILNRSVHGPRFSSALKDILGFVGTETERNYKKKSLESLGPVEEVTRPYGLIRVVRKVSGAVEGTRSRRRGPPWRGRMTPETRRRRTRGRGQRCQSPQVGEWCPGAPSKN